MVASSLPVSNKTVLEARDLTVCFRSGKDTETIALNGLNIQAEQARVTGFVGPDGAGKTTLLRLCAGLLVPSSGHMQVLGEDVAKDPFALRNRIGYMPQQFGLYEDLTVQENLDLYADLQGVPRIKRQKQYDRLMGMTGLGDFMHRLAGRLSGGMKQKLGLACCLVKSPEMLILDEPTVGVDPVSRRDLWKIIYDLVEKEGIGVVLSTAYLDEAERCDFVYLLHQGSVLREGTPRSFRERVSGRVRILNPQKAAQARRLQAKLASQDGVIDATIRSGRVRVVVQNEQTRLPVDRSLSTGDELAEPVFEDAFIDYLVEKGARHALAKPAASIDTITSEPEKTVIQAKGLTKKFGDFTAVRGISFSVARGEVFGLLGANGAGKTTTFRMLCGLLPITDGEVRVAGQDLRSSPARARSRLGYMAQKFSLYQQLSVLQNLRFYGKAYGIPRRRLRERIDWAMEEFDLGQRQHMAAGELPGGYRQRLAMATAMLHKPDILFLDEPTSGADPLARREFWLRINGFAEAGVTVIVTTHFMEEAEFCDRMIIMSQGSTLAQGSPAEIRNLAKTPQNPEPTIEDAFIRLSEGTTRTNSQTREDSQ